MEPLVGTGVVIGDLYADHDVEEELTELVALLFQQYAKPICAYIQALVNDWELAYDLTQETYLRLHQTRGRLPAVENRRAWVYRIATNLTLNEVKRRKRFAWLPWSQVDERRTDEWPEFDATLDDQAAVNRTLAQLSAEQRAPLLLAAGYGFTVREVAETLGISESAAKTRLYRARERFRQLYAEGEASE
ncbi:MAG: RNA polymerase sigma factor [Caldilineaceae bacterium]